MPVLIVGGGKMGLSHLAILARLIGKSEVHLCDSSWSVRHLYSRFGFKTYTSLDQALESKSLWKGAVISTPTSSHFPIAHRLLKQNVPCFIEKPLTLDVERSQELMRLSEASSTYVQIGLVARFIAAFIRVRSILAANIFGSPISYEARMLGNVITRRQNNGWRTVFKLGGGCLNEYGPHLIDLCRYLFGEVVSIDAASVEQVFSTEADDRFSARFSHESGCIGGITLDWCDATKRKATLAFDINFACGLLRVTNTDISFLPRNDYVPNQEQVAATDGAIVPHSVDYYLRGEEYSLQLAVFAEAVSPNGCGSQLSLPKGTAAKLSDGLAVDQLIGELAARGGLS